MVERILHPQQAFRVRPEFAERILKQVSDVLLISPIEFFHHVEKLKQLVTGLSQPTVCSGAVVLYTPYCSMQMLQLYFEIIKCKVLSLRIHNQFTTLALSVYLKISVPRMQPGYYLLQVLLILSWKR